MSFVLLPQRCNRLWHQQSFMSLNRGKIKTKRHGLPFAHQYCSLNKCCLPVRVAAINFTPVKKL